MRRTLTTVLALMALSSPAAALELRSDLPLWGTGAGREQVWPQQFSDGDSFGCALIHAGDWRYRDEGDNPEGPFDWLRIGQYGAFHCAARFMEASRREALSDAAAELGFIVELGVAGEEDLVAMQIGLHSSRYVLLAAPRMPESQTPARYRVLEPDCPRRNIRKGRTISVFITSYCVVNDRRTMISIARSAARKPSEAWLERVPNVDPPGD